MERWIGVVVSGDTVKIVDVEVDEDRPDDPLVIVADTTINLPNGERPQAYNNIRTQIINYCENAGTKQAIVKESALSLGSTKKGHLLSCELRGVVLSAVAESVPAVKLVSKANISKTFGKKKVDEYTKDDEFWENKISGVPLRVGSREAAMLVLATRKRRK